jgi:hypothetical protein
MQRDQSQEALTTAFGTCHTALHVGRYFYSAATTHSRRQISLAPKHGIASTSDLGISLSLDRDRDIAAKPRWRVEFSTSSCHARLVWKYPQFR